MYLGPQGKCLKIWTLLSRAAIGWYTGIYLDEGILKEGKGLSIKGLAW